MARDTVRWGCWGAGMLPGRDAAGLGCCRVGMLRGRDAVGKGSCGEENLRVGMLQGRDAAGKGCSEVGMLRGRDVAGRDTMLLGCCEVGMLWDRDTMWLGCCEVGMLWRRDAAGSRRPRLRHGPTLAGPTESAGVGEQDGARRTPCDRRSQLQAVKFPVRVLGTISLWAPGWLSF